MDILNSEQIYNILNTHSETRNVFLDVFSLDEVPLTFNVPCCFVVNTHKRKQPGEHWLAIYISSSLEIDFFDSYGHSPSEFNLDEYLNRISRKLVYNNKQIQSFTSKYCGYYCLFFILSKVRGNTMNQFKDLFSENTIKNDQIIKNMIDEFDNN